MSIKPPPYPTSFDPQALSIYSLLGQYLGYSVVPIKTDSPLLFWTPHWPGARLRPAKLKQDAVAVIHPQRRILVTLSGKLEQELKRMEDLGVTVRVTEPIDWVNSIATPGKQRREI